MDENLVVQTARLKFHNAVRRKGSKGRHYLAGKNSFFNPYNGNAHVVGHMSEKRSPSDTSEWEKIRLMD